MKFIELAILPLVLLCAGCATRPAVISATNPDEVVLKAEHSRNITYETNRRIEEINKLSSQLSPWRKKYDKWPPQEPFKQACVARETTYSTPEALADHDILLKILDKRIMALEAELKKYKESE